MAIHLTEPPELAEAARRPAFYNRLKTRRRGGGPDACSDCGAIAAAKC